MCDGNGEIMLEYSSNLGRSEIKHMHVILSRMKMSAYDNINVDHRTLNNYLYEGSLYLNRLMFSLEPISLYFNILKGRNLK